MQPKHISIILKIKCANIFTNMNKSKSKSAFTVNQFVCTLTLYDKNNEKLYTVSFIDPKNMFLSYTVFNSDGLIIKITNFLFIFLSENLHKDMSDLCRILQTGKSR